MFQYRRNKYTGPSALTMLYSTQRAASLTCNRGCCKQRQAANDCHGIQAPLCRSPRYERGAAVTSNAEDVLARGQTMKRGGIVIWGECFWHRRNGLVCVCMYVCACVCVCVYVVRIWESGSVGIRLIWPFDTTIFDNAFFRDIGLDIIFDTYGSVGLERSGSWGLWIGTES